MEKPELISFGATDIGRRRRTNEDNFYIDDELGLYIVADGMGGHAAGEVASSTSVETVSSVVARERKLIDEIRRNNQHDEESLRRLSRLFESSIQAAAYMVHSLAEVEVEKMGMGTTISALLVIKDFALTGQVGDSRIYYIRNERAVQLTEDHTLINWQLKEKLITAEEAARAKNRNVITRAVGSKDYVQVDIQSFPVMNGDKFLLCSDGLYEYINMNEIAAILNNEPEEAVMSLIDLASNRGGKDNITAVVVSVV